MPAKITVAAPVADVSVQRPRISIAVQAPRSVVTAVQAVVGVQAAAAAASLRYTVAASAVDFILLQSSAVLDTTGRYQYTTDQVVTLDGARFALAKEFDDSIEPVELVALATAKQLTNDVYFEEVVTRVLTYIRSFADDFWLADTSRFILAQLLKDQVGLADQLRREFAKATRDEQSLQDGIDAKDFSKGLQDVQGTRDALFSFFAKAAGDLVTPTESSRFDFASRLFEAFGTTDAQRLSVDKLASSTFGTTDLTFRAFGKSAFDAFELDDAKTISVGKGLATSFGTSELLARQSDKILGDSFGQSDSLRLGVGRVILDGVAMNDSADFADGLAFSSNKSFMNMAFVADARIATVSKAVSEAAPVTDSGSVRSQSYCDFSYFAEDYVGDSRNF